MIVDISSATIYQRDNQVLQNVNLKIDSGEFVYLIGKTGSGKSSLLKTLYGELALKEGNATVVDFDLNTIKRNKIPFLRRKLGIVFQDFQLLTDRNVYDNLKFVLTATGWDDKSKMESRINEVLSSVGLTNKGYKFPHELSGGEQQRVVIARALLNEPDLILADEPTGNLDPETSEEILKLLVEISNRGKAILMATHDFHLMEKFPSRTLKCENGQVVDTPSPKRKNSGLQTEITEERRSGGENL
ncbi:MAG: ATP-binding cassette domain-containing protein [Flavobacteriales bacterium]|nr:ATP-binding cassette domain-containing protein [Flavobacteriales bacterium]